MAEEERDCPPLSRTSRLYVKNLPPNWNEFDVYKLFKGFGIVYDVRLPDIEPHFTSRYGFVEMRCPSEVARAIQHLNGVAELKSVKEVDADYKLGSPLYVTWCQDNYRRKHPQGSMDQRCGYRMSSVHRESENSEQAFGRELGPKNALPADEFLLELPNEKENFNCSVESWASAETEQTDKNKTAVFSRKRILRFNPERHVPVMFNDLVKTSLAHNAPTKVVLLWVEAPNSFFVSLESNMGNTHAFMDKLTKHFKDSAPLQYLPVVGEVCVAELREGGELEWQRAAVIGFNRQKRFEADRPNRVQCLFIDKGITRWTDIRNVRPIHKDFVHFPIQAIHCGLSGIKPRGGSGKWSGESTEWMIRRMREAEGTFAELKGSCGEKSLVEIIMKDHKDTTRKECALSKELISRQFADSVGKKEEKVEKTRKVTHNTVERCLRIEEMAAQCPPLGETVLLTVFSEERGEINVVCVAEEKTNDFMKDGRLAVEVSHLKNAKMPGFKPRPGDVITYHRAAYCRGVVLSRAQIPGQIWVENLETGTAVQLPNGDVHPAEKSVGVWPPCRIKCSLHPKSRLTDDKLINGVLYKRRNGEIELQIVDPE